MVNVRNALFVIIALLPMYLLRFHIGPFPTTVLEVLIVATIVVWIIRKEGFGRMYARLAPWRLPLFLFLFSGIMSIIVSSDPIAGLGLFRAYLLEPIFFFLMALAVFRDENDVVRVARTFAILTITIGGYAIFQFFTGFGIPYPWDTARRATSFFPFPNAVGLFLAPLVPWFVALTVRNAKQRSVPVFFWGFAALVGSLAIIFSQSEGAWVGVAVGIAVLFLLYRPRVTAIALVPLTILFLIFIPSSIKENMKEKIFLRDWSGKVRQVIWKETITMLSDRPIFGVGMSGYPSTIEPYHKATYIEIFQYPHNILLNFWSELGLLGVISFIWILIRFFILSLHAQRNNLLALGLAAGMIALLVHGLVDVPYFKNDLAIQFWILVAVMIVLTSPGFTKTEKMVS